MDNVTDDGARRGSDNRDFLRQKREGALVFLVEQPLGRQSGFELFKSQLEDTYALGLQILYDNLIDPFGLVHIKVPHGNDCHSVLWPKS